MPASSSDVSAAGIGTMPEFGRLPGFIGPVPQPLLIRLFSVVGFIIETQRVFVKSAYVKFLIYMRLTSGNSACKIGIGKW